MKILNLYCGLGGNRKLWGNDHEITAIELDPKIAETYHKFFPNDTVIVADAHQYLLDHFAEFDFIWSSPPCPTHTKINLANVLSPYKDNTEQLKHGGGIMPRYPEMSLYQEIIFLQNFFKGKYCVENVISYYKPLIEPQEIAKHYFWSNFYIRSIPFDTRGMGQKDTTKMLAIKKGYEWGDLNGLDREKVLRNCVEPETGLHIFNEAFKQTQNPLF